MQMERLLGVEAQVESRLSGLIERYPMLEGCRESINAAFEVFKTTFSRGGTMLVCGNGGSAADAIHLSGELLKGFLKKRPLDPRLQSTLEQLVPEPREWIGKLQEALPVLPLGLNPGLMTAVANDQDGGLIFAQQVTGVGREQDCLLAISTSGNSANILKAVWVAKAKGLTTVGLTGAEGGMLRRWCDICIQVPASETYQVQELHLPVYHVWAAMLEEVFFT